MDVKPVNFRLHTTWRKAVDREGPYGLQLSARSLQFDNDDDDDDDVGLAYLWATVMLRGIKKYPSLETQDSVVTSVQIISTNRKVDD